MSIKRHIPNFLTTLNLIFGCISIMLAISGLFNDAVLFILVAAVLDFFDGLSARLLKVNGPLGKELDSLADMVTFGVAPTFFIYYFLMHLGEYSTVLDLTHKHPETFLLLATPALSAIRLAKFNIDTRQVNGFIGLNTPTNTLLLISLPFIAIKFNFNLTQSIYFMVGISILSALLLNANIPMLSLKFKNFNFKNNLYRYILIGSSLIVLLIGLLVNFIAISFPIIVILYLILSIIHNQTKNEIQSRN